MIKVATLSLIGGTFLTAGLAYAYARQAQLRRLRSEPEAPPLTDVAAEPYLRELEAEDAALMSEADIDVEIVDIDTLSEEEEPYDATSPDDLGAVWLARATQTSGEHGSSVGADALAISALDEDDDLDPAGRPTDPPEEIEEINR